MALKQNTWTLNQWYDQDVAGNVSYTGAQGIYSWGSSPYGELGQNDTGAPSRRSSPVQVGSETTWSSITGYYDGYFYGATKTDGTLWMWGANTSGSLGTNQGPSALTGRSSPTQITGTTWARAYAGPKQCQYATKTDGSLWGWGYNGQGQIAQNNATPGYSSPIQIGSDTTWPTANHKMGGHDYGTFAIKTDGTLWAWGGGNNGKLGLNTPDQQHYSSPTQIGSGSDWDTVSKPSRYMGAAIKTDGTLWMWGMGNYGQLGQNNNGDNHQYSSPVQIPGTTWKLVCGASQQVHATKTDGTLWSWGRNTYGNLGHNNETSYSSPVQVGSSTDWDIPLNLSNFGGGIKTDGSLWGCGYNGGASLAQNDRTDRSSPVQVPGNWVDMAGSGEGSTFLAMNLL